MKTECPIAVSFKMRPEFVYDLVAIKRDSNGNELSRRSIEDIHNLFTNTGVEQLMDGSSASSVSAVIGTGNRAPAITDTLLQTFLASRPTGDRGVSQWFDNGDGTGYYENTWVTVFPVGTATGIIAEVGSVFGSVAAPGPNTPIASRALVVDTSGNPTTFEVLADEELQLTQYFRRHVSYADQTAVINVNGTDHTITWRPWGLAPGTNWADFPGAFAPANIWVGYADNTGNPVAELVPHTSSAVLPQTGGSNMGQSNTAQGAQQGVLAYTPGSKKRQLYARFPTGASYKQTWVGGGSVSVGIWQFKFVPAIPKTNLQRFTFTFELQIDNTP